MKGTFSPSSESQYLRNSESLPKFLIRAFGASPSVLSESSVVNLLPDQNGEVGKLTHFFDHDQDHD